MDKSSFRRVFGDSSLVKVLDFLLCEGRTFDYSLTEIARNSDVAWSTLHEIFPKFKKLGIVKHTREIARAKMYKLNEENPIAKELIRLDNMISDYFIQKELEKQSKIKQPLAVK